MTNPFALDLNEDPQVGVLADGVLREILIGRRDQAARSLVDSLLNLAAIELQDTMGDEQRQGLREDAQRQVNTFRAFVVFMTAEIGKVTPKGAKKGAGPQPSV